MPSISTSRWLRPAVAGLVLLLGVAAVTYAYRDTLGLAAPSTEEQVRNVRAFAKLYGYVRYFHPSDAAAETDWDKFAVHGVRQVKDASSPTELQKRLEALFEPIAPTVQLYRTGDAPSNLPELLTPSDTSGLKLVSWQHEGLGLQSGGQPYHSIRVNKASTTATGTAEDDNGGPFAWAVQNLDPRRFQGKEVRFRAAVRTGSRKSKGYLYLHSPSGANDPLSAPTTAQSWTVRERTVTIPPSTSQLQVGVFVRDPGTVWFDEVELLVRDSPANAWRQISLDNAGFELSKRGLPPSGWKLSESPGSREIVDPKNAFRGHQALKLHVLPPSELRLFEKHPFPGETVQKLIGHGLSAQIPLALYSRDGQTLRPSDASSPKELRARLDSLELVNSSKDFFSANVVAAWNIFQHFYPYLNAVEADWDSVLTRSLRRSRSDRSREEFHRTLQRLVAQLQDGHGSVSPSPTVNSDWPILLDRAENKVVVAEAMPPAGTDQDTCPDVGDIVESVDGTPVEEKLRQVKRYISGSRQYKDARALQNLEHYLRPESITLTLRRDGKQIECPMRRRRGIPTELMQAEPRPDPISTLEGGIRYIDLTRSSWTQIQESLDTIAQAPGVIFDMRGYPEEGGLQIARHLSRDTLLSARFQTPQYIYPGQKQLAGYDSSRSRFAPRSPHVEGAVVFLTDAQAVSAAETLMGIVKHHDLGTVVGQPTAGANGNVNRTSLIGRWKITWTGMRVRKHDGAQHHLVGIQPDVRANRTIEGVRAGRDEVLEKGIEVLRQK